MQNPYRKQAQEAMDKALKALQNCLDGNSAFKITARLDELRFHENDVTCCTMEIFYTGDSEVARCVADAIRMTYTHIEGVLSVSVDERVRVIVVKVCGPQIMDDTGNFHPVIQADPAGGVHKVNCSPVDWIIGSKIRQLLKSVVSQD